MSVLELENVSKSFGGIRAVDGVSIGFDAGKVTGLIGPNGAGKTTLFNLISGFLHPDEGDIQYHERSIVGLTPWHIARMGIGRLFQDVRVFNRMTVLENVMVAFEHRMGESWFKALFLRPKVMRQENALRERAMELLEFVGLAKHAHSFAEDLSFGQQKLLSIARLLAADADVLLLDEPTAGVSPQMIEPLLTLIRKLAEGGKTPIVIEHNMNVIMEVCDWVYFMDDGQVIAFGLPDEVLNDREVRAVYIGL